MLLAGKTRAAPAATRARRRALDHLFKGRAALVAELVELTEEPVLKRVRRFGSGIERMAIIRSKSRAVVTRRAMRKRMWVIGSQTPRCVTGQQAVLGIHGAGFQTHLTPWDDCLESGGTSLCGDSPRRATTCSPATSSSPGCGGQPDLRFHPRPPGLSSLLVCGDATRNLEVMCRTDCDNICIDEVGGSIPRAATRRGFSGRCCAVSGNSPSAGRTGSYSRRFPTSAAWRRCSPFDDSTSLGPARRRRYVRRNTRR